MSAPPRGIGELAIETAVAAKENDVTAFPAVGAAFVPPSGFGIEAACPGDWRGSGVFVRQATEDHGEEVGQLRKTRVERA